MSPDPMSLSASIVRKLGKLWVVPAGAGGTEPTLALVWA